MRLLLIRHGQTPENVLGQLGTWRPGPGLTELGQQQAAAVPDALRGQPVDAVLASRLVRTEQTAQPLAAERGLEIGIREGLHEIEAGELELRSDPDAVRTYMETVFSWVMGGMETRMPGAGDGHEFFGRFDEDIDAIARGTSGTAAVFSHGAAIRVWTAARAGNIPPEFAADNRLENTGVVELTGSPGNWTLVSWAGVPVGGASLADEDAEDPHGETLSEARQG